MPHSRMQIELIKKTYPMTLIIKSLNELHIEKKKVQVNPGAYK